MGFIRPAIQAVLYFPAERAVILRERRSGAYRLSAYYLAKLASSLPLVYMHPFIFMCITYPMIGFHGTFANFDLLLVIVLLTVLTADGMGTMVSTLTAPNLKMSTVVNTVCILAMMLVSGLYVAYFPFWLFWIKYLSFFTFSFQALEQNEFVGTTFYQDPNSTSPYTASLTGLSNTSSATLIPGEAVLAGKIDIWNIGFDVLVIIGYGILFRILGYVFLMRSMKNAPV